MADFGALKVIKKTLLTPLIKSRSGGSGLPPPPVRSNIARHDHHNIEIKVLSQLGDRPSVVETEVFLFVPRSFELRSTGKLDLLKDFRSRVRLALPYADEIGAAALNNSLRHLSSCLGRLK